ncbi:DUF2461 domain-containing protein [Algoriphagus sp.]|uniref:DUF2461 domain-containing protein n=1 Tax=Algoriphagus sp. TaxID=1872435 RepID=UPI00260C5945|nr:DUF2461 domain-containing protein [Algoriphagus sp.]
MFTSNYLSFFAQLSENNNKDWFTTHKKDYEKDVKKPFEAFISKLIFEMNTLTPEITISPSEAIFRINKDIRFSADKSPYKTEMSAVISKKGKKSNPCPGLYLSLGAEEVTVAAGLKMLEKEELLEVRHHIAQHSEQLEEIIQEPKFKQAFGEIQGDKIKRIPEEFKEAATHQPLLYHTSFLAITKLPATEITKPNFVEQIMGLYQLTLPFAKFLSEPLEG